MPQGDLKKLTDLFSSIYLISDPYILKMLLASVISQDLAGDPVWIVIVAPSGGGKSEFINTIGTCPGVIALSTLTSHTFASGQRGDSEASLLVKMQNGILTFKDLTSLLSEHKDDRAVIMAQLREIYDGKYNKKFGTGKAVDWAGKITIIAGATFAIHSMKASYTAMGERFLFYNMIQPERIEAARRAMENQESGKMAESRAMLKTAVENYITQSIEIPKDLPTITKELRDELLMLAELATRARSDVERNWRSPQQEITEVHPPEMPTRVATQLQNFSRALMVINSNEYGRPDLLDEDKMILNKFTLDSITKSRRTAMQELARYQVITTGGLAVKLGLPTNSVRHWLEDLTALGIVERFKGGGIKGDDWKILPHYKEIISTFEHITMESGNLTEESAQNSEKLLQEAEEMLKNEEINVKEKEMQEL